MVEIIPFKGVRYNQNRVKDLAAVICPPYDIIPPGMQDDLYERDIHNFVRIEYNRQTPLDNEHDSRYTRAFSAIKEWIEQGVLEFEKAPSLYLHEHSFSLNNREFRRRNLLACVRLEEWGTRKIRPHENIIPRAKSDRMSMLYACRANTSPILSMYRDEGGAINRLYERLMQSKPAVELRDDAGEAHRMWIIGQSDDIKELQQRLTDQPIYIADGHHRYDSALTFRREMISREQTTGYNYVLMSLIAFDDPGLVILPPHRLVKGVTLSEIAGLKAQLEKYFDLEEFPLSDSSVWEKVDAALAGISFDRPSSLAVYGLHGDKITLLTVKDQPAIDRLMPDSHGQTYRKLDVSIVDHIILEKMLSYEKDGDKVQLEYSYNRLEAVQKVKEQQFQMVFILNPVRPEIIKDVADIGDRMPRKSTYFYPKSPAGLVFYKW